MGKTKREPSREESFHKHYAGVWGEERWRDSLYPSLARPTRHGALVNQFLPPAVFQGALQAAGISLEDLESVALLKSSKDSGNHKSASRCFVRRLRADFASDHDGAESLSFPHPQMSEKLDTHSQLMTHWNMDAASVLAASLLDVRPGEKILDLCAAPGGKSIGLAQDLFFQIGADLDSHDGAPNHTARGLLCSNEADRPRFRRLNENLKAYVPSSPNVKCTNINAIAPDAHRELATAGGWDKILVDAPCSSERHIIHAHMKAQASGRISPEMANWRPGSTKRLQEMQVKLLMTALRLLKNDGNILYATCSIEPGENDGVVEKVRAQVAKERKRGLITWDVQLDDICVQDKAGKLQNHLELNWAERTTHGWIVLPDHRGGGRWGPLFFTKLSKLPAEVREPS